MILEYKKIECSKIECSKIQIITQVKNAQKCEQENSQNTTVFKVSKKAMTFAPWYFWYILVKLIKQRGRNETLVYLQSSNSNLVFIGCRNFWYINKKVSHYIQMH